MSNSVERFSDRVSNYVKYRPDYPREIIEYLVQHCSLTPDSIVADVGCGTGISSRMFLEYGNQVFGVEPNAAMREAAIEQLAQFPGFTAMDGTAEETTLGDESVDLVLAAQAFHWFDPSRTRSEFTRILRPGGYIVLIWNERSLDADLFHVEYEDLLLKYGKDYAKVRHDDLERLDLQGFFPKPFREASFENFQIFDFEGVKGRMLSASYMPNEHDERFPAMLSELKSLFAKHAETGKIKVFYNTRVYSSPI